LAIARAEAETDRARIIAEDDEQLLADYEEENPNFIDELVTTEDKVKNYITGSINNMAFDLTAYDNDVTSLVGQPYKQSCNSQPVGAANLAPQSPDGPANFSSLSSQAAPFKPIMFTPHNDIVQLAAYRDLLTLDGGQSFSGDQLQYHLFMVRLNSGVLHIFGNSNPGVALQIVMKSCSGDAFAAIRGCAAISDKAKALKQALDILSRLFGSQRRAIGGMLSVCVKVGLFLMT